MSIQRVIRSGRVKYEVRWREHGRQPSRLFDLKRDADTFELEVKRRQQLGPLSLQQLTARGGLTLDQWIEQRWTPEHGANLEQSTLDRYASVYACHILRSLGEVPLGELTVARLREWQAGLLRTGTRPGTIHKCRTFLSSVLRHAAESEAIPANPLALVRAPKPDQRDAVRPLPPSTVEAIRRAMLDPPTREVAASASGQRSRRRYQLPAPGTPQTRQRDALIVSLLAYAGLRPGELCALRWDDISEGAILVQRATNPDGSLKPTKNRQRRPVRLLGPLAQDLREYRLAVGRPPATTLLLPASNGEPWSKAGWQTWRADRWTPACRTVRLEPVPRPYDLRHSFASLLLAERRQELYVARQLGHTVAVLHSTYAHLIDGYEELERVDAEAEIGRARSELCVRSALNTASGLPERPT